MVEKISDGRAWESYNAAVSGDGRIVAYTREEDGRQIVVHDRATGIERVLDGGPEAEGESWGDVKVSADGGTVMFMSMIATLTDDDDDPVIDDWQYDEPDLYFYDVASGAITRFGAAGELDGVVEGFRLDDVAMSADASRVVLAGTIYADQGTQGYLYLADRQSGELTLIEGPRGGDGTRIAATYSDVAMSADGGAVFFHNWPEGELHVYDVATGTIETLPIALGDQHEWDTQKGQAFSISADGQLVAYTFYDADWNPQVALYDRATGTNSIVTTATEPHHFALNPALSADGRFLLYSANHEFEEDVSFAWQDIYLLDRSTGEIQVITLGDFGGVAPRPGSYAAHFSGDGHSIIVETTGFWQQDPEAPLEDYNERADVYAFDNPFLENTPPPPNRAPVAADDAFEVGEDEGAVLDLKANDSDPDGDPLTIVGIAGDAVDAGAAYLLSDGTLAFRAPNTLGLGDGESAEQVITYTLRDSRGAETTGTVTITVLGANDAIQTNPDVMTVGEDGPSVLPAAALFANDHDPDANDTMTLVGITQPGQGTLSFDPVAQTISFDPGDAFQSLRAGETASQTASYTVRDSAGAESTASVVITIVGANDAPVAVADTSAVAEDAATDNLWDLLLANDRDVDAGDSFTIVSVNAAGTRGTVVFDAATRTLRYEAAGFDALEEGETATDQFSYTIRDASGAEHVGTVTMTIAGRAEGDGWIYGTEWDDLIEGTDGADKIRALGDADTVYGHAGDDVIEGGSGDDLLSGGLGADSLDGGEGNDFLVGDHEDVAIVGGDGFDRARIDFSQTATGLSFALADNDAQPAMLGGVSVFHLDAIELHGSAARDMIAGGAHADVLIGNGGDDLLQGGGGADVLIGGLGDDVLVTQAGFAEVLGGPGHDRATLVYGDRSVQFILADNLAGFVRNGASTVSGIDQLDAMVTGAGQDFIVGGAFADTIATNGGRDEVWGEGGDDVIDGGAGDDRLYGGAGRDRLSGGEGNDVLVADAMWGGQLPLAPRIAPGTGDMLDGGAGDDVLHAGAGSTLTGGSGSDRFVLDSGDGGTTIADFDLAGDTIDISALTDGRSNPFADGRMAIVAGEGGSVLMYDADGAGSGAAVAIATVAGIAPNSLAGQHFVATGADGNPIPIEIERLNRIEGTEGGNILRGTKGDDQIVGKGGIDLLYGGNGNDLIDGGDGLDVLRGDAGDDRLLGGAGIDMLDGGSGNDVLAGGTGADVLSGGSGDDRFVFGERGGHDVVLDFGAGKKSGDTIDLSAFDFADFGEVKAAMKSWFGQTTIDLGEHGSITLAGVRAGDLQQADFIL